MTIEARHERRFHGAATLAFAAAFLAALLVPELARADDSPLPGAALGADLRAAVSTGDKQAVAAALDLPPTPRPVEQKPSPAWTPTTVDPATLPQPEPTSVPADVPETSGTAAPETPPPAESATVLPPTDPPAETPSSPPVEATPSPPQGTASPEEVTPAVTLTVPTSPPAADSSPSPSITLIVPPSPQADTPVADEAEPPPPTAPISFPELSDPPAVLAEAPPPPAPAARRGPAQVRSVAAPSPFSILQVYDADPVLEMPAHASLALAVPARAAAAERNSFPLLPPDPLPDAPSAPFGLSAAFSGSAGASPLVMFAIVVALLLLVPPWFARRLPIRAAVWRQGTLPAPLPRPG